MVTDRQVERLLVLLERLTLAIERIAPDDVPESETPVDPPACEHPADRRVDFGMTGGMPDWECAVCRYRPLMPSS